MKIAKGTPIIVIDKNLRTMHIPDKVRNIGVTNDSNAAELYFKAPRFYNGIDLASMDIRIVYLNANEEPDIAIIRALEQNGNGDVVEHEDTYNAEDKQIEFKWKLGRHACAYSGDVKFSVSFLGKKQSHSEMYYPLHEDYSEGIPDEHGYYTSYRIREIDDTIEINTLSYKVPVLEGLPHARALTQYDDVVHKLATELGNMLNDYRTAATKRANDEKEELKNETDKHLQKLEAKRDESLQSIGDKTQDGLTKLEDKRKASVDEIESKHSTAVEEITSKHTTAVNEITSKNKTAVEQINTLKNDSLSQLEQKRAESLKQLQDEHTAATKEITEKHQAAVKEVKDDQAGAQDAIAEDKTNALDEIKKTIDRQAQWLDEMLDYLMQLMDAKVDKADINGIGIAESHTDMTDTSKIYVYTGNEEGYVNGNWYYNKDNHWVSGGVYNAAKVDVDRTLTIDGAPSDSKTVGDRFKLLNEIWMHQSGMSIIPIFNEENGYISATTGELKPMQGFYSSQFMRINEWANLIFIPCTTTYEDCGVAFYDKDKKFISGYADSTKAGQYVSINKPENAVYFRVGVVEKNASTVIAYYGNLSDLADRLQLLVNKVVADNKQMLSDMAEFKEVEDDLRSNAGKLRTELTKVKGTLIDTVTRTTALEGRADAVEQRATDLEGRATSLETRATDLEGRTTALENRATEDEKKIKKNTDDIAALQQKDTQHDKRMDDLQSQITTNKNNIKSTQDDLSAKHTELTNKINSVQDELKAKDIEIVNELHTAEQTTANLTNSNKEQHDKFTQDIADLNAQTAKLRKMRTELGVTDDLTTARSFSKGELVYRKLNDGTIQVGQVKADATSNTSISFDPIAGIDLLSAPTGEVITGKTVDDVINKYHRLNEESLSKKIQEVDKTSKEKDTLQDEATAKVNAKAAENEKKIESLGNKMEEYDNAVSTTDRRLFEHEFVKNILYTDSTPFGQYDHIPASHLVDIWSETDFWKNSLHKNEPMFKTIDIFKEYSGYDIDILSYDKDTKGLIITKDSSNDEIKSAAVNNSSVVVDPKVGEIVLYSTDTPVFGDSFGDFNFGNYIIKLTRQENLGHVHGYDSILQVFVPLPTSTEVLNQRVLFGYAVLDNDKIIPLYGSVATDYEKTRYPTYEIILDKGIKIFYLYSSLPVVGNGYQNFNFWEGIMSNIFDIEKELWKRIVDLGKDTELTALKQKVASLEEIVNKLNATTEEY